MKRVFVYKANLLPYSETFIKEQVLSYSSWQPILIGERAVDGISLEGMDVRLIGETASACMTGYWKVSRRFGVVPQQMIRRLLDESACVFHAHFGTDAVKIWPVAKQLNVPFVVTLHGYDINIHPDHWKQGALAFRNYPARLRALARNPLVHFVAVSESIRQRAMEFGIASEQVSVRYIGIDTERFVGAGQPVAGRRPRILFVGRLVEKKGVEYLIKAFARIQAVVPGAELVVVGDGPLLRSLQKLAADLRVPVTFSGSLPSAEVKNQIDLARVFCLPSIVAADGDAEGLGIVILEAQACGVPVVTSARGGATEGIIEGATGFAFPEKAIDTLVDRLAKLLTDDALADSMSRAGPPFISEKFDIRRCTSSLESLYEKLVDGHGHLSCMASQRAGT